MSSCNARITDSCCDEGPRSKRICSSDVRARSMERTESENRSQEADFDAFGPGTPTSDGKQCELARKYLGGWETLEFPLLERVARLLPMPDLCRLAQVNKHYHALCARDALWSWRAAEIGFVKSIEHKNWLSNIKAAVTGSLHVAQLDSFTSMHFTGDVTIVDPFSLFFQGRANCNKQAKLRNFLKETGHNDLVLTYRGIQSAVLRTSCIIHDDDTAFEVFRNGYEVGANVTTSGVIAVVPKRLVLKLIEENGGVPEEIAGVTLSGVDGILRRSLDGDFIIRHSKPGLGTPVNFPFTGETDFADVVCSTGGSWTEDSDSDDEEEELTDEEMAEAVAEVAKITNSFTSPQYSHCGGEGLIHKFTNFEVSMLS